MVLRREQPVSSDIKQTEADDGKVAPLVVRPRAARVLLGNISEDTLYRKIRSGAVDSFLDGRRR